MTPLLGALVTSPAAPFIALSAVVAAIYAARGKIRGFSSPVRWGLFAFIATHLVMEAWRLGDDTRQQVQLFGISLFVVAAIYALISDKAVHIKVLIATITLALAVVVEEPTLIRIMWLLLAVMGVAYCYSIWLSTRREAAPARIIWAVLVIVHSITVVEQIDCQILPGIGRPFEEGAACSYVWNDIFGIEFSYYLYALYTSAMLWALRKT